MLKSFRLIGVPRKGDDMSDLIIIAEMLETVMGNEDLRERVLDSMDLSDDEAWRVVEEFTKSLEVK